MRSRSRRRCRALSEVRERDRLHVNTESLDLELERFGSGAHIINRQLLVKAGYGVPGTSLSPSAGPSHHVVYRRLIPVPK